MNWQAVGVVIAALGSLAGVVMGALSLRMAVKRHEAQAATEEVDLDEKRQRYEEEAAMRRSRFYATSLGDADEEIQRMRRRHEEFRRDTERKIEELEKAIADERAARKRDAEEYERNLAALRAESERQIAELHVRIGRLTMGQQQA